MVYGKGGGSRATLIRTVPSAERQRFCISDAEVLSLADIAVHIEEHYSRHAGIAMPMDIEWAKDGTDSKLYIIQARPETVASQRSPGVYETYDLKGSGTVIVTGRAVGEKIVSGRTRRIATARDLAAFRPGEILVAPSTSPDWEPVMKIAAGVITDKGGRTCHAAIVARELGIPAVVGATHATEKLKTGTNVTISCAEGDIGNVYQGTIAFDVTRTPVSELRQPHTAIMVNVGTPEMAFRVAMQPQAGVGLARNGVHHQRTYRRPPDVAAQAADDRLGQSESCHRSSGQRLQKSFRFLHSDAGGRCRHDCRSILSQAGDCPSFRLSRPTNTPACSGARRSSRRRRIRCWDSGGLRVTATLPMLRDSSWSVRGALRRVREEMGLSNLRIMVPFCRTVEEGRRVIATMAANGLKRGEGGLEIYVMCEIPNNVIQIDAFSELFDGFSIGSNDLTQLTLGVDRDSDIVAFDFDERDPGMLEMFRQAVAGAKRNGRHVGICEKPPPITRRSRAT